MNNGLHKILLLATLLALNLGAKAQSYCTPDYTFGCAFGANLSEFKVIGASGVTLHNIDTACSPGSYGDFASMSVPVYAGGTYATFVATTSLSSNAYAIWLDKNNDGSFDISERIEFAELTVAPGDTGAVDYFLFNIPSDIIAGTHRLRVRLVSGVAAGSIDPCANYSEGETHDYTIDVQPVTACYSGGPAGTIVSTFPGDSLLPWTPFTLSVVDAPAVYDGYYVWSRSTDYGTTWSDFPPFPEYHLPTVVVPSNYVTGAFPIVCFMRRIFCGGPTGPLASTAITCFPLASFISSYATSGLGGGCGKKSINKVAITATSLQNSNHCDTIAGSGIYTEWPNADSFTTTVYKTVPFELKVSTGNDGSAAQIGAWIDYNHNGAFDSTEFTLVAASSPSNTVANPSALFSTKSMSIPATALTGLTKMRLRTRAASATPFTGAMAQSSLPDGETEDYFITILEAGPCTTPVVSLGADTAICPGIILTLDAGNPGLIHDWSTGGHSQTISVNSPGTYTVTVADGACQATDSIVISAVPAPEAGAIFASGIGPDYTFSAGPTTGATTVIWYFGDGATANTQTASHSYSANGTYDVLFIATNACGESDTATGFVIIEGLSVGNTQKIPAVKVRVYPNPAAEEVTVDAGNNIIKGIEVMDQSGKVVMIQMPIVSGDTKLVLSLKPLAPGSYSLRVQTNKGRKVVKLVIK